MLDTGNQLYADTRGHSTVERLDPCDDPQMKQGGQPRARYSPGGHPVLLMLLGVNTVAKSHVLSGLL